MQFSLFQIISVALLASSVQAGYNCKCQDDKGQYDILTNDCCLQNVGKYRPDLNHQVKTYPNTAPAIWPYFTS